MRARFLLLVAAVIALAAPAGAQNGLDMLPSDAAGVLTVPSLARFYTVFEIDALRTEYPEKFAFLSSEMVEDVGVDLLNPKALSAQGFDLERPLYVGFLVEPSAVVLLIPGEDRALSWVRAKVEDQGVKFGKETDHAGTKIESDDADDIACFARGGYIAVVVTDKGNDGAPAVDTAKRLIDAGGGLSKSDLYKKVMSRLPSGTDLQFYLDGRLQRRMSGWGRSAQHLKERGVTSDEMDQTMKVLGVDGSAGGVAVKFESDRLEAYSYNWVGKKAAVLTWFRVGHDPVPFMRRVPANPWLIMLARINGAALWNTVEAMRHTLPGAAASDDPFAKANGDLGIDVEKDLIDQIDGNAGLLIDRVSMMSQEVMLLLQVVDPARMGKTLETFTEHLRSSMKAKSAQNPDHPAPDIVQEKSGDAVFYRVPAGMAEVCYGLVDDHLVVTSSAQRFRDLASGGTGFVATLKNSDIRDALLTRKAGVFYLDFQGLSRDAQGFLPMMGPDGAQISSVLAELSELAATSDVDGEGGSQTLTLTSTSPGVWKRLLAVGLQNIKTE